MLIHPITWYGESQRCAFRCLDIHEAGHDCMSLEAVTPLGNLKTTIHCLGKHLLYPALSAAAVGAAFGLSLEELCRGIESFVPTKMRMDVVRCKDGITILNDTYNANPQSMRAAVSVLADSHSAWKAAVLGDMLELGPFAPALHSGVGEYLGKAGINCLVAVG